MDIFLEIISPEEQVFDGKVDTVILPGKKSAFQVLKSHMAIISTLEKGKLVYRINDQDTTLLVEGGIVEVLNNKIKVLVEGIAKA